MLTPAEVKELVTSHEPIILDIGCNEGDHTRMFLGLFPRARVFSFEADPRPCGRFRKTINSPRVSLFETAVGSLDGVALFHQSDGQAPNVDKPYSWDLSGSIKKPAGHLQMHPWCRFDMRLPVPITRLDTWAEMFLPGDGHVDFIWMDVQGAEGDVISGAHNTLSRTLYFYTEYSNLELYEGQPNLEQLKAMLPRFEVARVFQYDVLFRNTIPAKGA